MAQDSASVYVGVAGSILSFPTNAPVEHGAWGKIPTQSMEHGFVSEDGITISTDRSTDDIIAWQNASTVRTVTTAASITMQFKLLQSTADNKELYYGTTANSTTQGYHWNPAKLSGPRSWFIDVIDPARNHKVRYYLPFAEVTEIGEQVIANAEVIGYDLTLTAYSREIAGEEASVIVYEGEYPEVTTPPKGE